MAEIFRDDLLGGRVAIVTGGGSGLGRATALELSALGARVVVCGRREELLRETAELGADGMIDVEPCDIRDEARVRSLVAAVLERHRVIDVLVNNAGGQFLAPAESVSANGFRTVMQLNVEGTWLMTHAVATAAMIPTGRGGKVINITLSPHAGHPGIAHSCAARAAVENLTRTLSAEWARHGIRINAIAAGQFATETLLSKYPPQVVAGVAESIPLGRMGEPRELAWAVAYLASRAGDFVSGTVLTVDGARDNWRGVWPPPDFAADRGREPVAEARRG